MSEDLQKAHLASKSLLVEVEETVMAAIPKVFKSGSLGWHGNTKMMISDTRCQVNILITVIGSKPKDGTEQMVNGLWGPQKPVPSHGDVVTQAVTGKAPRKRS